MVEKGGRGKKAPYASKAVWCPEPILEDVEKLIEGFRASEVIQIQNLDFAIDESRKILEKNKVQKKSTKYCLGKLLEVLYSQSSINL